MKKVFTLKSITKLICITAVIACIICICHVILTFKAAIRSPNTDSWNKLEIISRQIVSACLSIISLFISFKARETKGRYLFALFLACLILNWLYTDFVISTIQSIIDGLESTLTGVLFIRSMQFFPKQITKNEIENAIKI